MNALRLRFKEFSGDKINFFTIKDIANIQVGRDLKESSFSEIKTDRHYYPVYSNTVENRGLYGFYDFEEYDGNSLTVVGRRAGLGTAFSRYSGFGAIGRLLVISPKNNEFNVHYFAEYVNFKLRIHNECGGIPQLPGSTFGNYPIVLPSLPEQTKIANFITAVDEKIAQLTQKGELLARYKKGVMQHIFSQQLRFKDDDGRDFPDWEDSKLTDVATIVGGGTPDTTVKKYWNGEIQWFTPTELKTKYMSKSLRTITESGLKNSSAKILPVGTLLFSSRATVGDISIALNECTTNQGFQSFIVNNENCNKFVYYWILNNKNVFLEKASGSTFLEISKKEIEKLKIKNPSILEQTKIANFLTAIDDKISHNQTQLNAMKQYKQGLLQQLFV